MRGISLLSAAMLLQVSSSVAVSGETVLQATIPGSEYVVIVGEDHRDASGHPDRHLLLALAGWAAREFDLPVSGELPTVELVPVKDMIAVRYYAAGAGDALGLTARNVTPQDGHEIVAVYDDRARTIYLAEDWSGRTPGEISVLAHEIVHHLQNLAGVVHGCAEEREKLAYRAQDRLLSLFGQTLESAFDIDPMTRLVRTNCFM